MAVVFMHVLPRAEAVIFIRPFLNFSVGLFIFLSGYLTPAFKMQNLRDFYSKRIIKISIPYVVYTVLYLLFAGRLDPFILGEALLLGKGSGQLYYVVVYLQLVLLTPFLFKILKTRLRFCLYAVTPLTLLVKYFFSISGGPMDYFGPFCGTWIIFYVVGLEWKTVINPKLTKHGLLPKKLLFIVIGCLALQIGEGWLWKFFGSYSIAISQLKLSTMIGTLAVIAFLMTPSIFSQKAQNLTLMRIFGDLSFGIYLIHVFFIKLINPYLPGKSIFMGFFEGIIVLLLSALVVALGKKILPKRIAGWLGFR